MLTLRRYFENFREDEKNMRLTAKANFERKKKTILRWIFLHKNTKNEKK